MMARSDWGWRWHLICRRLHPFRRVSMRLAVIARAVLVLLALAAPAAAQLPSDAGTVSISVRPATADVFVDGERWVSPESSGPLVVQLAPGRHTVDVRAPGYRPFSTVVEIRRG